MRSHDLRSHFLMRPALGGVGEVGLPGGALRLRGGADCCGEGVAMPNTTNTTKMAEYTCRGRTTQFYSPIKITDESNLDKSFEVVAFITYHNRVSYLSKNNTTKLSTIFNHVVIQSESLSPELFSCACDRDVISSLRLNRSNRSQCEVQSTTGPPSAS